MALKVFWVVEPFLANRAKCIVYDDLLMSERIAQVLIQGRFILECLIAHVASIIYLMGLRVLNMLIFCAFILKLPFTLVAIGFVVPVFFVVVIEKALTFEAITVPVNSRVFIMLFPSAFILENPFTLTTIIIAVSSRVLIMLLSCAFVPKITVALLAVGVTGSKAISIMLM